MSKQVLTQAPDGTTLYVEFDEDNDPYLHLDFKGKWSLSTYKVYFVLFAEALDALKAAGHDYVYLIIPKDEKLLRFEQMFGFQVSHETDSLYFLFQEI